MGALVGAEVFENLARKVTHPLVIITTAEKLATGLLKTVIVVSLLLTIPFRVAVSFTVNVPAAL